jgi:TonB family protein
MGFMSSSVGAKALPPILQRWLQDPVAISAIGSLALHLPLLFLLPRLFTNARSLEEPDLKSAVDVVELSPAEQGRIADFQTPEIILPPLSQTPSALSITPLPKPSTFFSEPSLPPLPNSPSSSLWGLGSSFQFPPIGNTNPPAFVIPRTQTPYIPYIPPSVTVRPTTPPVVQSPTASPSPSPSASPSPSPSPNNPVAAIDPVTTPSPTGRTEEQVNQDLQASIQERRESLTFNEAGTTEGESTSALQKWLEVSGQPWLGIDQGAVISATEKLSINGSYPAVAGYRNLSGAVIVAILVDEDGKPASESAVTILRSSGYRVFDRAALQDALSYEFKATGKKATYFINVVYAPNRAG